MFSVLRPSPARIQTILQHHAATPVDGEEASLLDPGRTLPPGFRRDQQRDWLGTGESTWQAAVAAIRQWRMIPREMVGLTGHGPIAVGEVVGVLLRVCGVWSFNPCRIIRVIDESDEPHPVRRFGLIYRALPGHAEAGDEMFLVECDKQGQVWYRIDVVSRPRHPLLRLFAPWARALQARFRRLSADSMLAAVARPLSDSPAKEVAT